MEKNSESFKNIERIAAILSISGAIFVALNSPMSKFGYLLWLIANPMYVYVMYKSKLLASAGKEFIFLGATIVGFYNWWL